MKPPSPIQPDRRSPTSPKGKWVRPVQPWKRRPGEPRFGALAFTLVELLIVIAIIGVLSVLLIPALSRSKSTAHRIKCVANLRQLGLAAQMYWDDNSGRAFRYRGGATNGGDVYWFGWLARGSEGQRAFDTTQGSLYPYLGGRGVELCPALNSTLQQFKLKATGAAYGYGYNLQLSAPPGEAPLDMNRLAHPSGTALLADAAQINTFLPPASPQHPMLEEFYYFNTNEPTVHFRHSRTASVVFCDLHVAAEKPTVDSLDKRLTGQSIGRLAKEIVGISN